MNPSQKSLHLQNRIQALQRQLAQLDPLRPGCLSRQYRKPKAQSGAYYQLSYTYQRKGKTEYIPAPLVPQIQQEVAEYKRYRQLTAPWLALSLELSRLKIKHWKPTQPAD